MKYNNINFIVCVHIKTLLNVCITCVDVEKKHISEFRFENNIIHKCFGETIKRVHSSQYAIYRESVRLNICRIV